MSLSISTGQQSWYFERLDAHQFLATRAVAGVWNSEEQHIAPALGLLAHAIEADIERRRGGGLKLTRLSYDILGTLPIDRVEIEIHVLRPGRTIELVEARLVHAGRTAVVATAWLLKPFETAALAGHNFAPIVGPGDMPVWEVDQFWPAGGFISTVEVRRQQIEPGRASSWVRTQYSLLKDERISTTASALGILDIANGLTPRLSPDMAAFPNVDLTVHLHRPPEGEWIGFDTMVAIGSEGTGLTHSIVHDMAGPWGVVSQSLTVRPR